MKNIFIKKLAVVLFFVYGALTYAQAGPPVPGEGTESGDTGGISQPIDGYVIWLLAVGVIFLIAFAKMKSKQIKNI